MTHTILGIHSNTSDAKGNGGAGHSSVKNKPGQWSAVIQEQKADGHAWISLSQGGQTKTYGLWPDSHPAVIDNGKKGSDVRVGMEDNGQPDASRYYKLTGVQLVQINSAIQRHSAWRFTNNCSSWASDIIKEVVKEDVNADDWGLLGIETPRQLGASIKRMEVKSPTSMMKPQQPKEGSSLSRSSAGT